MIPTGVTSELVLGPSDLDISGGDALTTADPSAFDKQPKTGNFSHRSVYWQKVSQAGYRLVVDETPYGWRGDQYAIFAVPEATKSDDFIAQVSDDDPRNQNTIRPMRRSPTGRERNPITTNCSVKFASSTVWPSRRWPRTIRAALAARR
ncbi:hypothetical protein LJR290_002101 [Variovorax sp. LjRoot290]|uniref:hypothetical protein n=1 Tax=Variovorax sp. LjRoot290 TaxID=3342316 RepID=UPI003ED0308B